jgi:hypothetical protein
MISDKSDKVVVIEIELSDWLLAIFMPLEEIYLQSHKTFSARLSSLIPFLYIKTTVANIAGEVMIKLSLSL